MWTCVGTQESSLIDLAKYSQLTKVVRIAAYVIRFLKNFRRSMSDRPRSLILTVEEIQLAKKILLKIAQRGSFPHEVIALQKGKSVSVRSRLVTLSPFMDGDGIIRVGGRIEKADIPFETKHHVVLAPDHELTRLIIMDYHRRLHHEGVDHLRNELRQRYWVLRGRTTIRKFLHQCSYYKKRRARPEPPRMAELPRDRLQVAPVFSKVGVDYFGPLTVKHLRKTEKRYGCLFTCLITRSVHLEVAHSLDTDSFVMCLRRFIARRGKPSIIYSDNGTNFVGANRELRESLTEWNQERIANMLSQQEIKWVFNPHGRSPYGGSLGALGTFHQKGVNCCITKSSCDGRSFEHSDG